jgi:hypothetical protein
MHARTNPHARTLARIHAHAHSHARTHARTASYPHRGASVAVCAVPAQMWAEHFQFSPPALAGPRHWHGHGTGPATDLRCLGDAEHELVGDSPCGIRVRLSGRSSYVALLHAVCCSVVYCLLHFACRLLLCCMPSIRDCLLHFACRLLLCCRPSIRGCLLHFACRLLLCCMPSVACRLLLGCLLSVAFACRLLLCCRPSIRGCLLQFACHLLLRCMPSICGCLLHAVCCISVAG